HESQRRNSMRLLPPTRAARKAPSAYYLILVTCKPLCDWTRAHTRGFAAGTVSDEWVRLASRPAYALSSLPSYVETDLRRKYEHRRHTIAGIRPGDGEHTQSPRTGSNRERKVEAAHEVIFPRPPHPTRVVNAGLDHQCSHADFAESRRLSGILVRENRRPGQVFRQARQGSARSHCVREGLRFSGAL